MPRTLPFALDRLQVHSTGRSPRYRVEVYDVRSTDDTISNVVRSALTDPLTGPRDFTDECERVTWTESAGSYLGGIPASTLSLNLVDPHARFSSVNLLADPTGDGRWLRAGNVVRLIVGDASIDQADWVEAFTGFIVGQSGSRTGRTAGRNELIVNAVSRESAYIRQQATSPDFGQSTSYLSMAQDIAEIVMGLDADEIEFSGFGARTTGHASTQFVEEPPMVSLAKIMIVDGFLPIFNGEGKLTFTQANIGSLPDRTYENLDTLIELNIPPADTSPLDEITVLGLNADMTKVSQPFQDLQEIQLTTGWFTQNEDFDVYWSEDRTMVAENIDFDVKRSVNGAVTFGGSESFSIIPAPSGLDGTIGGTIEVTTGFAPALIISLTVGYIAAAWIPDEVVAAIAGVTIPVGRSVQALALVSILLVMAQIGRLHVVIRGNPLEYVFAELSATAFVEPLGEQPNPETVENPLVQDQVTADSLARELLFREVARANPRSIVMLDDLRITPNDVQEFPDVALGPRRFLSESITRVYSRADEGSAVMSINSFEITAGLLP